MKLSEVIQIVGRGDLYRECEFDQLILFGIPYEEEKRNIAFIGDVSFIPDFSVVELAGVVCTEEVKESIKDIYKGGILVGENPKGLFFTYYNYILLKEKERRCSIPTAIGDGCNIHSTAIIATENVKIGSNVSIGPFSIIEEDTTIEDNAVIGAHCVIGAPAFFYFEEAGQVVPVLNNGGVKIGKHAEVHNNCVVEKAVFSGNTAIGANVKLDNLTCVSHDVQIGEKTISAAGSIFGGYTNIEDDVFIGLQATIIPNIKVGAHSKLSAGAVVTKAVQPNTHMSGNFAIEHAKFIKNLKGIK